MNLYRDESVYRAVRCRRGPLCPCKGLRGGERLRGRWRLRCATGDLRVEIHSRADHPGAGAISVTALGRDESLALPAACR
jgi:hypothetical protein